MFGEAIKSIASGGPISLPCQMYEPLSVLQRSVEMFEFRSCLDKANQYKDAINRIAFVSAFAASSYAYTVGRFKTNFNPILGESFEFVDTRSDPPLRAFAEQLSHHPPLSGLYVDCRDWKVYQNSNAGEMKNQGTSVVLDTKAKTYVELTGFADKYFISSPCTKLHNLLLGNPWLEHYGDLVVTNLTTGDTATIKFKQAGVFEGVQKKIGGFVVNKAGKKIIKLSGDWTSSLKATWGSDTADVKKGETLTLWQFDREDCDNPYHLTNFSMSLTELDPTALPTDSRRRLDSQYLKRGDPDRATAWKRVSEAKQRADEKLRNEQWSAQSGKSKPESDIQAGWKPVWFRSTKDHNNEVFWEINPDKFYWSERDACLKNNKDPAEELKAEWITGTAVDFPQYETLYTDQFEKELGALDKKKDKANPSSLSVPGSNNETKSCEDYVRHHKEIPEVKSAEEKGNPKQHVSRDKKPKKDKTTEPKSSKSTEDK